MSKLAHALQFNQAGRIPKQSLDFLDAEFSTGNLAYDKEYKLTARLQARAVLTQEALDDSAFDIIEKTKQHLQRSIIEEVFGEFRSPMHELRKALYDQDCYQATEILNKLHDQMFNEGIG